MGRKRECIFKRKDGRYEGRFIKEYKNDKPIYGYVYAHSYSECQRKRNTRIKSIKNDEINGELYYIRIPKTLNNLIFKWLRSKENIKSSSYTRYYNLIDKHIRNDIGKLSIHRINSNIIKKFINDKLDHGRLDGRGGLSRNTIYDLCNILKQVFKYNKLEIEVPKITKKVGMGRSLSPEDRKKLLKKLNEINNRVSIGIELSLLLGLRESEVCGIRFCDIDLKNKVIRINHIISRIRSFHTEFRTKLVLSTPKTEQSKRVLPIPSKLQDRLSYHYHVAEDKDYFLLTGRRKFMDPRTLYNNYKKILNKIDIEYTYHDLRHTFATNCIAVGIDYKSLMELLGHTNITTTMNIYAHPTMSTKRKYVNKL